MPSQEELNKLFNYEPETGQLTYKVFGKNIWPGKNVGYLHKKGGYVTVPFGGKPTLAHRVIWIMLNGGIPAGYEIDHINRIGSDNRISNLRLVTPSENKFNRRMPRNNTSGVVGVCYWSRKKVWAVTLGKARIGWYKNKQEAIECRLKLERESGILIPSST